MKGGLMIDLHGTLLYSNLAWALAYESFDKTRGNFYREEIDKKRSRYELAEIVKVPYSEIITKYRSFLRPRIEVIDFTNRLNFPKLIVSNSDKEKVIKDLAYVPNLNFQRIYTIEDGTKPEFEYLEKILTDQNWDFAYLIGNDFKEDYSKHPKVMSIIIPQPKLVDYL